MKKTTIAIMLTCLFLAGCEKATTHQPATQNFATPTQQPEILATATELQITATKELTPTATSSHIPRLQLTYQIENQIHSLDVSCVMDTEPCFGATEELFRVPDARGLFVFSWSGDGKKVVYEYDGDVFVSDWDGKNKIQISDSPDYDGSPEWLPGQNEGLFYVTKVDDLFDFMVSDGKGEQKRIFIKEKTLDDKGEFSSPDNLSWSKDGSKIVLRAYPNKDYLNRQLFLYDLDNDQVRQISYFRFDVFKPSFSKDGSWVIYTRDVGNRGRDGDILAKLSLETGKETVLLQSEKGLETRIRFAQWSPLGDWICFVMNGDVYLIRPDGSQLINVTNTPDQQEVNVAWRFTP